jgi:RimJ/RimL family protein N-acetyltransferase
MLAALERFAVERRRTRVTVLVDYPYDLPEDGSGDPGADFLVHRGYVNALVDVKRRLPLPVPVPVLDELARQAAGHHTAYRLRDFVGRCPDDLVDSYAALKGTLMVEAPMGDLDLEGERYDEARVRHEEQIAVDSGRTAYVTVAQDPDGEVVAYTEVQVPAHEPGRSYQWGTLVDPRHRGHRLGLAVKVANLRALQAGQPGLRELFTYNAEVNAHMVAVNEQLGFAPIARCGEFQKVLA